ncbi:C-signal-like [Aulostomus maculatus]
MAAQTVSILITGANRGLGLEMVKQMVEAPSQVRKLFACCREPNGPSAEALQTLAKKHPDVISVISLDVSDLCSIKKSAQLVGSQLGPRGLNLLVNNAGVLAKSSLLEASPEDMQHSFKTNLMGPMFMIKEFLPLLGAAVKASVIPGMSCSKAAVISISSVLGSVESVKYSYSAFSAISYRISKAGLNMLTACAAEELKKDGILFSVLHPGWVRTDMGGEEGEIDAPVSVQGMLKVMASLTEEQNGAFLDYKGQTIAW